MSEADTHTRTWDLAAPDKLPPDRVADRPVSFTRLLAVVPALEDIAL